MTAPEPGETPQPRRRLWLWLALGLAALVIAGWRAWPALVRALHPVPPGHVTLYHVASNWSTILSCG